MTLQQCDKVKIRRLTSIVACNYVFWCTKTQICFWMQRRWAAERWVDWLIRRQFSIIYLTFH